MSPGGGEERTLEQAVHRLLARQAATVAVAESLTGGLVGARLTAVSGASNTFLGGLIAYTAGAKRKLLGVSASLLERHGTVDPDVARAMAVGARDLLGASYGLALTGVAGPGPQEGKPAGTVYIALTGPAGGEEAAALDALPVPADRAHTREHAATCALDLLRGHLCAAS